MMSTLWASSFSAANEAIVGAGGGEARQDITRVKKKVKPPVKAEQEEWGGITTTTE